MPTYTSTQVYKGMKIKFVTTSGWDSQTGSNFEVNAYILTGPLRGAAINEYSRDGKHYADFWRPQIYIKSNQYKYRTFSSPTKLGAVKKAIDWALNHSIRVKKVINGKTYSNREIGYTKSSATKTANMLRPIFDKKVVKTGDHWSIFYRKKK